MKPALLFALALVAACGSKSADDDGKVASCHMEAVSSCREYRGGNLALGTESLKDLCTVVVSSAQFTETACPTAKRIASCAKAEGKDYFYEGYSSPVQTIEETCKQLGGTFAKL
jgi:hypothetical protein